ncbi:MAG: ribonuclease III [Clostridia bacterium]|nr:ribonuclease III [Clostridia bacterium]
MQKYRVPQLAEPISISEAKCKEATSLSFIGDAVHTLAVRQKLMENRDVKTGLLHRLASLEVNAEAQSHALKRIENLLTEDETDVYKRCRNAKQSTMAKHASAVDYKIASGFEGLIGFLYLSGQSQRIAELLTLAYDTEE